MSDANIGGFRIHSERRTLVAVVGVVCDGDSSVLLSCRGAGLSNAVTSWLPALYLSLDHWALCPFWELPHSFRFFRGQQESGSIACTRLLLPPPSTT